jgi:hypothetical protein
MKIYELKQQQQELLDELYWLQNEEEADILKSKLEQIEGSIERKLSFLSDVLAESIALAQLATEARKIASERLERKEKQAKRAEEKLREFILSVMKDFDIKSVKGDILNVSRYERDAVQQSPSFDIDTMPTQFLNVSLSLNKKYINDFIKEGGEIDGFEIVKKDCLRIS